MGKRKALSLRYAIVGIAVLACLHLTRPNYLLFHSLAEVFSIVVACGIFMVAWNTRAFVQSGYLPWLGIAYLFVAALDFVHMLAYPGMGVFSDQGTNLAAQLWISARGMGSLSLLLAVLFLRRRPNMGVTVAGFAAATALLLGAIFHWRVFPLCYDEAARSLTVFKVATELSICAILIASAVMVLLGNRGQLSRGVLALVLASIATTAASELAFTMYHDPYALANLVGHYLKIVSFFLIYKALVETAMAKPFDLLFRDLKQSEQALRHSRGILETRLAQGAEDLAKTVQELDSQARDRRRAEELLRESEQRYRSLVELSPDAICVLVDGKFVYANPAAVRLFGASEAGDLIGRAMRALLPPQMARIATDLLDRSGTGPVTMTECEIARLDGQPVETESIAATIAYDGQPAVLVVLRDITPRKELEDQVTQVSEAERQRIGQDLHDGLGQLLAGLGYLTSVLQRKLSDRGIPEAMDAATISGHLKEAIVLTRSLARGLCPVDLKADGLTAALRELAARTEETFHVPCVFRSSKPVLMHDSAVATHLYRIAQEALNNAVRHGRAKHIAIDLSLRGEELLLSVADDGVGIRSDGGAGMPSDGGAVEGMGLRIMDYRARAVGGRLEIAPAAKGGTCVTCRAPLKHPSGDPIAEALSAS